MYLLISFLTDMMRVTLDGILKKSLYPPLSLSLCLSLSHSVIFFISLYI